MLINKNWIDPYSPKNSSLSLYLVIFILLICSRLFDIGTTYLATPNLAMESNVMVRFLGFEWFRLIVLNIFIILIFFLLFRYSWARFTEGRAYRNSDEQDAKPGNFVLEIGITLPIYVIITGYFQGFMNILVYMEWILISFTNLLFLYPLIVGGIFGSISLYLAKKILYSKNPESSKPAHKVMVAKREYYNEEFVEEPEEVDEFDFPPPPPPPDEMKIQFEGNHNPLITSNANSLKSWISISEEDRS